MIQNFRFLFKIVCFKFPPETIFIFSNLWISNMFSFSSTVSRILTWFTLQHLTECNFGFSSRQLVRNRAHLRLQENVKSGRTLELEDVCELEFSLASTEHNIILCWNRNKKLELFLFDFRCHSRSLLKSNIKLIFKSDWGWQAYFSVFW